LSFVQSEPWTEEANGATDDAPAAAMPESISSVDRLSRATIVLTTYPVLQQEVNFYPDNDTVKSLRRAKKYPVPQCPLLAIDWWRVSGMFGLPAAVLHVLD
jgi:hypothetical protein